MGVADQGTSADLSVATDGALPTDDASANGGPSILVLCSSSVMRLYTDAGGADELVAHLKLSTNNGDVAFPSNAGSFAATSVRYFANANGTLYMGTVGGTDVVMTPILQGGQSYTAMDVDSVSGETITLVVSGGITLLKRLVVNAAIPDVTSGGTVVQWNQGTSPDCVIGGGSSGEPGDLIFTQNDDILIGGRCVDAAPPGGRPVAFKISQAGTSMAIVSVPSNQRNTQIIGRDSSQRLILIDDQGKLHDGTTNPATLLRTSTCTNARGAG